MKIVVGTINKKKLAYFKEYFLDEEVTGVSVPSGVSEQPLTEAEVMEGAYNRAKNALKSNQLADFGVGMEGGSDEAIDGLLYYVCIVVMLSKDHKCYIGISSKMPIPKKISDEVKLGKFLVDELKKFAVQNQLIRQLTSREKMFKEAMGNLVIAYQNKELF